ncbi:MAG: hypothetical protein IPL52_17620 [Flavobacteriales bacterium]|nr:hypothetical protein [Flavobacteriales bacterium]
MATYSTPPVDQGREAVGSGSAALIMLASRSVVIMLQAMMHMTSLRPMMPTLTHQSTVARSLLLSCGMLLLALAHAQSSPTIRIRGRIIDAQPGDHTTIFVRDTSGTIKWAKRTRSRAFRFDLPSEEGYRIGFQHPGALDKEVYLDTHHAHDGGQKRSRTIRFTVMIEEDKEQGCSRYANAVGQLRFHHSNGRLNVDHDYTRTGGEPNACEP